MERMNLSRESFVKALVSLEDILNEEFSVIVRDATIQRFEYTFEAMWKSVKIYLKENEGIPCNSPKSCFRELLSLGLLSRDDTEVLLEMTDMRNLTSHTYIEDVAVSIYEKIVAGYVSLMRRVADVLEKE